MANDKTDNDKANNDGSGVIQSMSREARRFPPPAEFTRRALLNDPEAYERLYRRSIDDPEGFWGETARAELLWSRPFTQVLSWDLPWARWFEDGEINLSANCLDRHLATRGDKVAIEWEGEPGDSRTLTYRQLHTEVCKFANVLKGLGVQAGDRVAIYMPMIPEAAVAMLACTRIGATHTVVFGGFSAEALRDRINDCGARLCITADGGWRRGKAVPLKVNVDQALADTPTVDACIVVRRTGEAVQMQGGRDYWWNDLVKTASPDCPPASLPAEHPLFILYTSGTTGKPKGIVHTTGGYLLGAHLTTKLVFDLHDDDVYWCTADIGWVTGHSYVVYGPLSNGATTVMYEGAPDHPQKDRSGRSSSVGRSRFSTRPRRPSVPSYAGGRSAETSRSLVVAAARQRRRAHQSRGLDVVPPGHRRRSLSHRGHLVADRDGGHHAQPHPRYRRQQARELRAPVLWVDPAVVKKDGTPCAPNEGGFLILRKPWPSMLRGIHGNPERYEKGYWSDDPRGVLHRATARARTRTDISG